MRQVLLSILAILLQCSMAFNCTDLAEVSMRNDEKLLGELQKQAEKSAIDIDCLGSLIRGNHF